MFSEYVVLPSGPGSLWHPSNRQLRRIVTEPAMYEN